MIHSDSGRHMVACDGCGTELGDHDDFQEAVNEAKREGWEIKASGGVWSHHCPTCREGVAHSRLEQARRMFGKH